MRNSIRRSTGMPALRSLSARCTSIAQRARIDHAVELDQQFIAHGLEEPSAMGGDLRLEDLMQVGLKTRARSFLVGLAEAAIAGDVGDQDCGKPALHAALCPRVGLIDEGQALTDRL